MKKVYLLAIAVVALMSMMAFASQAFAADEWLLNGAAVAAPQASVTEGKVVLEDQGAAAGVECEVVAKGSVGAGAADKVESVEFKNCKGLKNCSSVDSVSAVNLPWNTSVELSSEKFFDLLSPGVAGKNPGYLVECVVLGLLADDVCTRENAKVELKNLASDVEDLFNTKEKADCSLGGKEKGEVSGSQLSSVAGSVLQVS